MSVVSSQLDLGSAVLVGKRGMVVFGQRSGKKLVATQRTSQFETSVVLQDPEEQVPTGEPVEVEITNDVPVKGDRYRYFYARRCSE